MDKEDELDEPVIPAATHKSSKLPFQIHTDEPIPAAKKGFVIYQDENAPPTQPEGLATATTSKTPFPIFTDENGDGGDKDCLLYTSPSPRD